MKIYTQSLDPNCKVKIIDVKESNGVIVIYVTTKSKWPDFAFYGEYSVVDGNFDGVHIEDVSGDISIMLKVNNSSDYMLSVIEYKYALTIIYTPILNDNCSIDYSIEELEE